MYTQQTCEGNGDNVEARINVQAEGGQHRRKGKLVRTQGCTLHPLALVFLVAICVLCALTLTHRGGGEVALLDDEWVDATPAFGMAMSTDDLKRQIHWLHKHNAAESGANTQNANALQTITSQTSDNSDGHGAQEVTEGAGSNAFSIETPSGAALQPANKAALTDMRGIVTNAYDAKAQAIGEEAEASSAAGEEELRGKVALLAAHIMHKIARQARPSVSAADLAEFVKALGAPRTAHLCTSLQLPCPISSLGNAQAADVIAGFADPADNNGGGDSAYNGGAAAYTGGGAAAYNGAAYANGGYNGGAAAYQQQRAYASPQSQGYYGGAQYQQAYNGGQQAYNGGAQYQGGYYQQAQGAYEAPAQYNQQQYTAQYPQQVYNGGQQAYNGGQQAYNGGAYSNNGGAIIASAAAALDAQQGGGG